MRLLVFGGSGFLSRFVVREGIAQGHEMYYVTRGNREGIPGARGIIADRRDAAALRTALREAGGRFDAIIDCICFNAAQARDDIAIAPEFTEHVVVISTDSVYHPEGKRVPQDENGAAYMEDDSYGAEKRRMEQVFLTECPENLKWTLFRPPHMFGAGSELGCYPMHIRQKDLLAQLQAGVPLRLVDGGEYRIQPLYAGDMAKAAVAAAANPKTFNRVFCIAGPEVIRNRDYYEILGELLGLSVQVENADMAEFLAQRNDGYCYFAHRVYDLTALKEAGLPVPSVGLRQGLREQIACLARNN